MNRQTRLTAFLSLTPQPSGRPAYPHVKEAVVCNKSWTCSRWGQSVWFPLEVPTQRLYKTIFCSFENMKRLFTNYWREMEHRYCALFLLFSHLILVVSTSFSCSRHCCTTPPPPERMQSLASQQIMWHTRVLAEDRAMSHKGPVRVPDYDNIRKRREEEVSAGSWPASEGLGESHTHLCETPGCHPDSVMFMENRWHTRFIGCHYSSVQYIVKLRHDSPHVFFSTLQHQCCRPSGPCSYIVLCFLMIQNTSILHWERMDLAETT